MKRPSHPGSIIRTAIEDLGIGVTDAARSLGVSRQALHNTLAGRTGITAEMAVRLSKAFGSTPEFWLRLQMNYDLAQVRLREHEIAVQPFRRAS